MPFTAEQKHHNLIVRELKLRQRVYPRWVEAGKLSIKNNDARRQIEIMTEIAQDYEKLTLQERLI